MPYFLRNVEDDKFKVCKKSDPDKCFSKNGLTKSKAIRQKKAIELSERKKSGAIPKDKNLYDKIKSDIVQKYPKHSAYRSMMIVKEYKKQGGEFEDNKNNKMNTKKWLGQEWTSVNDVFHDGKIVPCGSSDTMKKYGDYPLCRPLSIIKRLNKNQMKKLIDKKNILGKDMLITKKVLKTKKFNIKNTKTGSGKDYWSEVGRRLRNKIRTRYMNLCADKGLVSYDMEEFIDLYNEIYEDIEDKLENTYEEDDRINIIIERMIEEQEKYNNNEEEADEESHESFSEDEEEDEEVTEEEKEYLQEAFLILTNEGDTINFVKDSVANWPALKRLSLFLNDDIEKNGTKVSQGKVRAYLVDQEQPINNEERKIKDGLLNLVESHGNFSSEFCTDKCSSETWSFPLQFSNLGQFGIVFLKKDDRFIICSGANISTYSGIIEIKYLCSAKYGFVLFQTIKDLILNDVKSFFFETDTKFSHLTLQSVSEYNTVQFYGKEGALEPKLAVERRMDDFKELIDNSTNEKYNDTDYIRELDDDELEKYTKAIENICRFEVLESFEYGLSDEKCDPSEDPEASKIKIDIYNIVSCGGYKDFYYKNKTPKNYVNVNYREEFLKIVKEELNKINKKDFKLIEELKGLMKEKKQKEKFAEVLDELQDVTEKRKEKLINSIKQSISESINKKQNIKEDEKGYLINQPKNIMNVEPDRKNKNIIQVKDSGLKMTLERPKPVDKKEVKRILKEQEKRSRNRQVMSSILENIDDLAQYSRNQLRQKVREERNIRQGRRLPESKEEKIRSKNIIPSLVQGVKFNNDEESSEEEPEPSGRRRARGIENKFMKQLESKDLKSEEYLKKAKASAKKAGYDPKKIFFSDDNIHKLMYKIDNKIIRFGRVGYGDFIIWSHLEKNNKVSKGTADKKRNTFRKSHGKITEIHKLGKNTANELAINVLW